jgi:hypothetical protein
MSPRMFRLPPLQVKGVAMPSQPPRLRVRGVPPNMPPRGGLGDYSRMPGTSGADGSPVWPYGENGIWGDGSQTTDVTAPLSPALASQPNPASPTGNPRSGGGRSASTPYGEADRPWYNPTTYSTVPILGITTGGNPQSPLPALSGNLKRNSLIIQNSSTATVAGDIAPTIYIGFNNQPQVGASLVLTPGLGFYWSAADCPPRDSIYILIGTYVNTGLSVVIAGCVVQGTYDPVTTLDQNIGGAGVGGYGYGSSGGTAF